MGGVVALLAVLALVLVVFARRPPAPPVYTYTPPSPAPTLIVPAAIRIQPVFANGATSYVVSNFGQADAREIHVACIVTGTTEWPVLRLHAPPSGQRLSGETLAPGRAMGLSLGACMNHANVGAVPADAYFLVRYFTPDGAERVEETHIEPGIVLGVQHGYRLVDTRVPSAYYREPLLAHLRRYAPPP